MASHEESRTRVVIDEPRHSGGLGQTVGLTVLIMIILWVALLVMARTDGFRVLMQDALGQRLGLTTTLEQSRLVFPLTLRLRGLRTVPTAEGAQLAIGELRVTPGRRGWLSRLAMRDVSAVWVRLPGGLWEPRRLAMLGEIPERGLPQLGQQLVRLLGGRRCRVVSGEARWLESDQSLYAAVEGLALVAEPVRIPGNDGYYFKLDIDAGSEPGGMIFQGIGREWLTTDASSHIELRRTGLPPAATRYWEEGHD